MGCARLLVLALGVSATCGALGALSLAPDRRRDAAVWTIRLPDEQCPT